MVWPFGTGKVLLDGQDAGVSVVEIGVSQGVLVAFGNFVPQHLTRKSLSFSTPPQVVSPRYNLAGSSAQEQPNPYLVVLVAPKAPHLIQLPHLVFLREQKRRFEVALATLHMGLD